MVDDPAKADAAARRLKENDVELVFLYISTYALSSTVLPVVQRLGVPVIVLNLQPAAAIDYDYLNGMGDRGRMTGEWLSHCQACSVPEVACVFNRLGLKYDIVTGYLAEESVWEQIGAWIEAAGVAAAMRRNRMGCSAITIAGCSTYIPTLRGCPAYSGRMSNCSKCANWKELRDRVTDAETAAESRSSVRLST